MARAFYCVKNASRRTIIGKIEFNASALINAQSSQTLIYDYLMTVVHETLHSLGFHGQLKDLQSSLQQTPSKPQHINTLLENNPTIYADGHWDEDYLPNDLMISYSRGDLILSVYTLELLQLKSVNYLI